MAGSGSYGANMSAIRSLGSGNGLASAKATASSSSDVTWSRMARSSSGESMARPTMCCSRRATGSPAFHDARHVVGSRMGRDVDARMLDADRIVRRVLVVLTDEHDGELPDRGDVQRLVELALGGGAIPKEAHGHGALALELAGESGAARDGQPSAHDPVGAQHTDREVRDVHGAALALAIAVDPAEQLGEHPANVGALGDAVPVTPVGARHAIRHGQMRADTDGHGLLAHVGMHRAVDLAGEPQLDGPLVELADQDHGAQHLHELRLVERHAVPSRITRRCQTLSGAPHAVKTSRGPP